MASITNSGATYYGELPCVKYSAGVRPDLFAVHSSVRTMDWTLNVDITLLHWITLYDAVTYQNIEY